MTQTGSPVGGGVGPPLELAVPPAFGGRGSSVGPWRERLATIVAAVREMSSQTDPNEMVRAYAKRMQSVWIADRTVSLSRRGHTAPEFRVTRSSTWERPPDPWRERDRLPVLRGGVLADLLYGDEPRLLDPFEPDPADPGAEYLAGVRSLLAIPHYENGVGLNMVLHMRHDAGGFDPDRVPELVQMSNLFGRATKNLVLSRELSRAYDALDAELRTVQDIQLSLLPDRYPSIPTLEVAAHYQTSARAGGDYYDFFDLGRGRWGILVADVSGHGAPAAVLMAVLHAIAHGMPKNCCDPHPVLDAMNGALCERYTRDRGSFVTAVYGVYDQHARTLTVANAGHPDLLLREPGAAARPVPHPDGGLPLGISPDARYVPHAVALAPGQAFALYTDGITEAFSRAGAMYGPGRLADAFAAGGTAAEGIVAAIIDDLGRFAGLTRSDDRTLVVGVVK